MHNMIEKIIFNALKIKKVTYLERIYILFNNLLVDTK